MNQLNQFSHHLQHATIGDPVASGNLVMFPLFYAGTHDNGNGCGAQQTEHLCFDDALAKEQVRVTEVDEDGSVPTLLLDNRGAQPVFLLDGEQLIGAKQNRTVNLSLLIKAGAKTEIPVSCVEAGRWSRAAGKRHFRNSRFMHYARGRRDKMAQVNSSLRERKSRHADQGQVWFCIDEKRAALAADAPTAAMDDIYTHAAPRIGDYERDLRPAPKQVGAVFAIDGKVSGFDLFADAERCAKYFPKLVGSYALDALETATTAAADADDAPKAPPRKLAADFLARFAGAEEEVHDAVGLGRDLRLETDEVVGAGLVWKGECVHLAGFAKDG